MKMVIVMDNKKGIDVTGAYKTLMADPSQINNMDVDLLKEISKLIREQEKLDSSSTNSIEQGKSLGLTNPYYKGEETRTNNNFNMRVDGFAGIFILSSITLIFGIIFMLIIFNV